MSATPYTRSELSLHQSRMLHTPPRVKYSLVRTTSRNWWRSWWIGRGNQTLSLSYYRVLLSLFLLWTGWGFSLLLRLAAWIWRRSSLLFIAAPSRVGVFFAHSLNRSSVWLIGGEWCARAQSFWKCYGLRAASKDKTFALLATKLCRGCKRSTLWDRAALAPYFLRNRLL